MTLSLAGIRTPEEVLPGDIAGMKEVADRLSAQAWTYEAVADNLAQIGGVVAWQGAAGDRFRDAIGRVPQRVCTAAAAHRRAGESVLNVHVE